MADEPDRGYGPERKAEILMAGYAGEKPEFPLRYPELEAAAREALDDRAAAFLFGGAGEEDTMAENRRAFDRWRLVPRVMRDISDRTLRTELYGADLSVPFLLAPVGMQSLYADGECDVARAAAELDVPMCLSSVSTDTMEDVADELGETPRWFQLYWNAEDDVAHSFVDRAEAAGYEAVVVTVDTPFTGWRARALEEASLPFFGGDGTGNYVTDPAFRASMTGDPDADLDPDDESMVLHLLDTFSDVSRTWADLSDLCAYTDLPLLVKGVVHPADARAAVDAGAEGVVVSNHGGRQVDGAVAPLTALPAVADAVGAEVPVLMDSGIRTGADIVRALALGADAVMLGRPYIYGLAAGGEDGVRAVLKNVRADLDTTMALCGYTSPDEIGKEAVVRQGDQPGEETG